MKLAIVHVLDAMILNVCNKFLCKSLIDYKLVFRLSNQKQQIVVIWIWKQVGAEKCSSQQNIYWNQKEKTRSKRGLEAKIETWVPWSIKDQGLAPVRRPGLKYTWSL